MTTGGGEHSSPAPPGDGLEEDAPHRKPASDIYLFILFIFKYLIIYPTFIKIFNPSFEICTMFTLPDKLSRTLVYVCVKDRVANFKED